jgi:uncharacterized protein (DUF433 family)
MKNWQERISIDPNIRFGKPCIKGTRIALVDIFSWLSSGMNNEEILEDFPELVLDDIKAALAYAAHREEVIKIVAA